MLIIRIIIVLDLGMKNSPDGDQFIIYIAIIMNVIDNNRSTVTK